MTIAISNTANTAVDTSQPWSPETTQEVQGAIDALVEKAELPYGRVGRGEILRIASKYVGEDLGLFSLTFVNRDYPKGVNAENLMQFGKILDGAANVFDRDLATTKIATMLNFRHAGHAAYYGGDSKRAGETEAGKNGTYGENDVLPKD